MGKANRTPMPQRPRSLSLLLAGKAPTLIRRLARRPGIVSSTTAPRTESIVSPPPRPPPGIVQQTASQAETILGSSRLRLLRHLASSVQASPSTDPTGHKRQFPHLRRHRRSISSARASPSTWNFWAPPGVISIATDDSLAAIVEAVSLDSEAIEVKRRPVGGEEGRGGADCLSLLGFSLMVGKPAWLCMRSSKSGGALECESVRGLTPQESTRQSQASTQVLMTTPKTGSPHVCPTSLLAA